MWDKQRHLNAIILLSDSTFKITLLQRLTGFQKNLNNVNRHYNNAVYATVFY